MQTDKPKHIIIAGKPAVILPYIEPEYKPRKRSKGWKITKAWKSRSG